MRQNSSMPETAPLTKTEISDWLKATGQDREWLASQLKVSLSIVNQWLAPKGSVPEDRLVSIRQIMERESTAPLIGDPEGNLVSFTLAEFERIEATRQRLHYEARPPMYRDAILAYIEADEAAQSKITALPSSPAFGTLAEKAAEDTLAPPVTETRQPVLYEKPPRRKS